MLILTESSIIAARDRYGRTPIILGYKDGAYALTSESTAFPNLDYETVRDLGPGEIVEVTPDAGDHPAPSWQRDADMLVPVGVLRIPHIVL